MTTDASELDKLRCRAKSIKQLAEHAATPERVLNWFVAECRLIARTSRDPRGDLLRLVDRAERLTLEGTNFGRRLRV